MVKKWFAALWCMAFHRWVFYDRIEPDGTRTPVGQCTQCKRGW